MLTCNLKCSLGSAKDRCGQVTYSPRSSVISDLNGQIENILPKRVARRSSKIELGREPISVLSERIRIEGVAYSATMWRGNSVAMSALGGKMAGREEEQTWAVGDTWRVFLRVSTADPLEKL